MLTFILFLLCVYFTLIIIVSILYSYLRTTILHEHLSVFTGPSSVDFTAAGGNPLKEMDPIIKNKLSYSTKVTAYNEDTRTDDEKRQAVWEDADVIAKNREYGTDSNLSDAEKTQFKREEQVRKKNTT